MPAVAIDRDMQLFHKLEHGDMVYRHDEIYGPFVALTKQAGKELNERNFTPEEVKLFNAAKRLEIENLESGNAIKFIRDRHQVEKIWHRVMPSRFVLTKKSQELGQGWKAKARWILLGHRDPDVLQLESFSPTPATPTVYLVFQLISSLRYQLFIMDVTSAFGQSDPETRQQGPLFSTLPKSGIPGEEDWVLIEVLTAFYGLVNAPSTWRKTVVRVLLALQYIESVFDPCLYYLPYSPDEIEREGQRGCAGVVLLDVDDFAQGGNERHQKLMQQLKERFRFGKWRCLYGGHGEYLGRTVRQREDFEVRVDMQRYIEEKLRPITLPRERMRQGDDAVLTEKEVTMLRGAGGSLLWVGKECRPDVAAACAMSMSWGSAGPTIKHIKAVNKTINELKKTSDVYLRILPVPLANGIWVSISDASVANDDEKSQGGFLIAFADKAIKDGGLHDFSVNSWKSHRVRRVVKASWGSEALAMDDGLAELEWIRALYTEAVVPNSTVLDGTRFGDDESVAIVRQCDPQDPTILVTDARALYDLFHRRSGAAGLCRRAQIDVSVMSSSAKALRAEVHWLPGKHMLADALTKRLGNSALVRKVLSLGKYALKRDGLEMLLDLEEDWVLIEVLTAFYGLVNAPSTWRKTVVRVLLALQYIESVFDPCLYYLPYSPDEIEREGQRGCAGVVLLDVDDFAQGGNERHQKLMQQLKERFRFGKWRCLYGGHGEYLGRTVRQREDFEVRVDMQRYIEEKLRPITLPRERMRQGDDAVLTEKEVTMLRGAGGSLLWVGKECRPDVAAACAMSMSWGSAGPTIKHIKAVNKTINELKKTSDVYLRILPVPLANGIWVSISDASVANDDEKSQGGFLIAFADKAIKDGGLHDFSVNSWKSHRVRRVVKASWGSEALAMDDGLAELEWIRALYTEAVVPNSTVLDGTRFGDDESVAIVRQCDPQDPTILVTDARALYDLFHRRSGAAGLCRRAQIDVSVMSSSAKALRAEVHWLPGKHMLADALTKRLGNSALVRKVLSLGKYALKRDGLEMLLDLEAPPDGCDAVDGQPRLCQPKTTVLPPLLTELTKDTERHQSGSDAYTNARGTCSATSPFVVVKDRETGSPALEASEKWMASRGQQGTDGTIAMLADGMAQLQAAMIKQIENKDDGDKSPETVKPGTLALPLLKEVCSDTSCVDIMDWMEVIDGPMSDLSDSSASWWKRVTTEAYRAYSSWSLASPLDRLSISPEVGDLEDGKFSRLNSRAAAMLVAALHETVRQEVVSRRLAGSTGSIIFENVEPMVEEMP
ncbi:Copia protein [Symbiodinium microadriaticum]|uniref:Copia protein n=1 Tax=Symbiodinium microadriaticum TaxID=2951 RepID=A0A1Q9CDT8_SYMMI|nr:Copia protein [Symbiodinium microadriaticum]